MAKISKKKAVSLELVDLSKEAVRRLPRPHPGFVEFAEPLLGYYEVNEAVLGKRAVDPAVVRNSVKVRAMLISTEASLQQQLDRVRETRLLHESMVWSAELEIYGRAQRVARKQPGLARGIEGFTQFMKHRPPKPKAIAAQAPATTAPVTNS